MCGRRQVPGFLAIPCGIIYTVAAGDVASACDGAFSLSFHCLFTAFPLPFLDRSLPCHRLLDDDTLISHVADQVIWVWIDVVTAVVLFPVYYFYACLSSPKVS